MCIRDRNLPPRLGLVEATVAALPSWTHMLVGFPVVRWPTFAEYIRSCVNILATEYHLNELLCQLQLMGKVGTKTVDWFTTTTVIWSGKVLRWGRGQFAPNVT